MLTEAATTRPKTFHSRHAPASSITGRRPISSNSRIILLGVVFKALASFRSVLIVGNFSPLRPD